MLEAQEATLLRKLCCAGLLAWAVACAAADHSFLVVQDAWIRQPPGTDVAAAYLILHNTGTRALTVVSVHSPVARTVMIHETKVEGGVSRMRATGPLQVLPGQTVKLEPGGLHAMMEGLTRPLKIGERVPLVLQLEDGSTVSVSAKVMPLGTQ